MSTPPEKPNASANTSSTSVRIGDLLKDGVPRGETGCCAPASTTDARPLPVLPVLSEHHSAMLPSSGMRWLTDLRLMTRLNIAKTWPCASLKEAETHLTELLDAFDSALMRPATDEYILKALAGLADAFQVDLPERVGLEIYVAALRDLPRPAFKAAVKAVVRRHKWPRLPYPADFIEAAQPELDSLKSDRSRIVTAITRVRDALAIQAAQIEHPG
jgi:hypothetical protein